MIIRTADKSLLFRLLTITLYRTTDRAKAARSRFEYGQDGNTYFLRPLGILHGLIGLTLEIREPHYRLLDKKPHN